jgi:DNA polymerase elongation subunit (family B)
MLDPTQIFNIDDDVVSYDHDKMAISLAKAIEMNAVIASNGSLYDKTTKGLFPTIVAEVFDERVVAKNKMKEAKTQLQKATTDEDKTFWDQKVVQHNNEQLAAKIQINSLYGALGNEHFRWFNLHQAKAVTFTGQAVIKWIEVKMNEYMNNLLKTEDIDYVIYCDTDSAYLDVTAVVDRIVGDKELSHNQITDIVDRFAQEKIEPMIERSYEEFAERTNAFENAMHMKREVIGSGVFMAKKKYIMRIYDDEGVRLAKPKMKIMGHEAIRSQTPDWIRERMVNLLEMVFTSTNDAAVNYLYDVKDEYESLSIDDVAETSGINELDKYTNAAGMPAKGAQSHIRAAIYYNKFIKQFEIDKDFVSIKEGDKIKLLTLNKRLNPLGLDIIGYPEQLPKEFGLHEFVDYDAMYQKLMLDPVKRVYDIVGWKTTKQKNLLDLMGMN